MLSWLQPSPLRYAWLLARQRGQTIRDWPALCEEPALAGASLAIVGNAGYLADIDQGREIDAHRLVLRMNNFRTAGFERQVGSRLDLFLTTFHRDVDLSRTELTDARWLVASVPNNFRRGSRPKLNFSHGAFITAGLVKLKRNEVFVPSRAYFASQYNQIGRYPTSGGMAILLALDHLLPVCGAVYITGFSFFQGRSHYFQDGQIQPRNHDVAREAALLSARLAPHLASGRVTIDPQMADHFQFLSRKAA